MKVFYSHFSQIRHSTLLVVGFIPYSILTLLYYLTFLGPNWSAGLRSWPDLVCHRLHRQVPCPLQNWSNNSEICVLVHFCSILVVAVVIVFIDHVSGGEVDQGWLHLQAALLTGWFPLFCCNHPLWHSTEWISSESHAMAVVGNMF